MGSVEAVPHVSPGHGLDNVRGAGQAGAAEAGALVGGDHRLAGVAMSSAWCGRSWL